MADQLLEQLPELTTVAAGDMVYVVTTTLSDNRVTVANLTAGKADIAHTHTTVQITDLYGSSAQPIQDGVAARGTSAFAAREDHVHPANVDSTAPAALASVAAAGTAVTYARRDHVHALPTPATLGAVPTTRNVNPGGGLTGGGTLSGDITLAVSINGQTEDTAPDLANDFVLTHDTSAGGLRKVRLNKIGSGTTASNSFANIAVAGQTTVAADSTTDTLTLVAGSNISLTTDATNDTITMAATTGGAVANSFANIVAGGTTVAADSSNDTLTLVAGSGITLTGDATSDQITIAATIPTVPQIFSTVVAGGTSLSPDQALDTLTINAGAGISVSGDASNDTITIANTGPTVGFTNVSAGGNVLAADSATDTLTIVAGSGIAITSDASTDQITIAATATGSGGSSTMAGLSDVALAALAAGDRLEYDTTSAKWKNIQDSTLTLTQNSFVMGDASGNVIAGTPAQARIVMADPCQVTISRHNPADGATTFDLMQDVEGTFTVTALSVACQSGTGTVAIKIGSTNVTFTGNATTLSIPQTLTKTTATGNNGVTIGSEVSLELTSAASLTAFRATLHLVRNG